MHLTLAFSFLGSENLVELVTVVMQRLGAVDEHNRPQLLVGVNENLFSASMNLPSALHVVNE